MQSVRPGTTIPVSKLVKDLGVRTDNIFSPSAQRTETANKARRRETGAAGTSFLTAATTSV